jgi:phosphate transport system permease protein
MAQETHKDLTRTMAAPGEPFVWISAMGLSIGLLMVIGLLGIIVANGIPVFWPKRVIEATIKPGVANPVPNSGSTITGELVLTRTKRIPILGPDGSKLEEQKEVQFYVGNKDAYGLNFVFANRADIESMKEPAEIFRIERLEYGIAFGYLQELLLANGSSISSQSPDFLQTLSSLVNEANERRNAIERIEKGDIGTINTQARSWP